MKIQLIFYLLLILFFSALPVDAAKSPQNYSECILEANRQSLVLDKRAIGRIKQDCLERFPESAPTVSDKKLSQRQLSNLELYTRRTNGSDIEGDFYNGNVDIIVTQITLLLTPADSGDDIENFFNSEEYEVNLLIPPYKTKTFTIKSEDTKIKGDFHWSLISAWGY